MTLKKMSVAANDIVLNNLVMRDETFKTIPSWCRRVLLNAHFSSAWLSKIPGCVLNPFGGALLQGVPTCTLSKLSSDSSMDLNFSSSFPFTFTSRIQKLKAMNKSHS